MYSVYIDVYARVNLEIDGYDTILIEEQVCVYLVYTTIYICSHYRGYTSIISVRLGGNFNCRYLVLPLYHIVD